MTSHSLHLQLTTEQTLIARETPSQRILEITLQAPASTLRTARPPLNLALVLDRSGSMSGEKLEYVKRAAAHVIDLLQEQDSLAVVAYDDEISLLSASTRVTSAARSDLKERVSSLRPGGCTNLSGGWLAGCQEVASAAREGSFNRALLLTDGLANEGITELEELARHARELSRRGISTSTFGVGLGFNEHLLEAMSNQGSGNFYFIETPAEIPGIFQREFNELAAITARDVELVLHLPPHVDAQVLGGFSTRRDGDQVYITAGSLFAGQNLQLYVKLLTPPAAGADSIALRLAAVARDETGQPFEEQTSLAFTYADPAALAAAPRRQDVLERFSVVDLAETANEALKLERAGQREQAAHLLKRSIDENRIAAAPAVVEHYEQLSDRMEVGMDETDRKQTHYAVYATRRRRGSS